MSEKRDLWVPAVLALGGIGILIAQLMADGGSTTRGVLAAILGLGGALACLPIRLRKGQARAITFGLGIAILLLLLHPGSNTTLPHIVAHVIAAAAFLLPLPEASVALRKIMLGAAAFFALLGLLALLGFVPKSLVALFLAGAVFMAATVWNTRPRVEKAPPPGQKICVYGGSFDPFHRGHRALAEAALRANDRLLIVVAGSAPHKFAGEEGADVTAFHHRVAMTRLGVMGLPRTEVLEMEGKRAGPSYTVDTLEVLTRTHPAGTQWRLLMGADMLEDFPNWREWKRIVDMATLLVAARPGHALERPAALDAANPDILVLDVEPDDVSSSAIRAAVAAGEALDGEVEGSVGDYLRTHGLYKA